MIWLFGAYQIGKCDEVPGLCHVETQFGHLFFMPLIPLGSVAMCGCEPDGRIKCIPVSLSIKSVTLGWLRFLCIPGAVVAGTAALAEATDKSPSVALVIATGIATVSCVLLFIATKTLKSFTHASYSRALDLARQVRVKPKRLLQIKVAYAQLTQEQADLALQQMEQQERRRRLEQDRLASEMGRPTFDFGQATQAVVEELPENFKFK